MATIDTQCRCGFLVTIEIADDRRPAGGRRFRILTRQDGGGEAPVELTTCPNCRACWDNWRLDDDALNEINRVP